MRLCNKNSVLNKSTLLLGCTSKADDNKTIGHFGEGYKLACLVFLRNGYGVTIENYGANETWTFKFSKLKKYDCVESLVVDVDSAPFWKNIPDNNLSIVIEGFEESDYEEYLDRCIAEDAEVIETSKGRILMDKEYASKIYVNGLYVAEMNNGLLYGYDLKPEFIKIGRDRNLVSDWDISAISKQMWLEVANDYEETICDMISKNAPDMAHMRYSYNTFNYTYSTSATQKTIADSYYKKVVDKHGEDVILAKDEEDRERLSRKYKKKNIVVVDTTSYDLITECSSDYEDMMSSLENEENEEEKTLEDEIFIWALEEDISSDAVDKLFSLLKNRGIDIYSV